MLVAGKAEKGKDEVDRFITILDSVVRLGNVYTKLIAAGCVLFSSWQVKFLCDRKRKVCAFVKFGSDVDAQTLKGRKEHEDSDVSLMVPPLAKFMENCLEKWLDYINEKRNEYYHLNFFTIDQMVILQRELVKVGGQDEPSDRIYSLLSAVKHDCSKTDLISAMKLAENDVNEKDQQRKEEIETEEEVKEDDGKREADGNDVGKFIEELMIAGYSEELAKQALKHVSADNIDEGIVWCMENEMETELASDVISDMDTSYTEPTNEIENEAYTGWTKSPKSISSVRAAILHSLSAGE
ncbi:hypothetical protein KUTeg_007051 [Tegillarca granosa]|uniref:UBA domain-containing protein n=1 Tax=Tegillarca granosa TaxID=220873 RepID=A0ABQ9FC56_TEGGR|nr:hypothetical protein KUTeg_007051 [Tegillarca granosa]